MDRKQFLPRPPKMEHRQQQDIKHPSPKKDHLSSLPPEILHMILSYLFPTHILLRTCIPSNPTERRRLLSDLALPPHPFHSLALVSRTLNDSLQTLSTHLLKLWNHPASRRPQRKTPLSTLMTHSQKSCVWCHKPSARKATLMNCLATCSPCDRERWPAKITRSAARTRFGLKDVHLFGGGGHDLSSPTVKRWEPLNFGVCKVYGVEATMFSTGEVERRAGEVREFAGEANERAREGRMREWNAVAEERERKRMEKGLKWVMEDGLKGRS